jgi:hypothetical protein
MIGSSPVRATAPVERLDYGRSQYAARTTTRTLAPDSGYAERGTKVCNAGPTRLRRARKNKKNNRMMSRSATATYAGRASSMRRLRRRATSHAAASATRPYCRTNGCASFLEIDATRGVATCPVCGYTRRTH